MVEVDFVNGLESSFTTALEACTELDLGDRANTEAANTTGRSSSGVGASLGKSGRSRLASDNRDGLRDGGSLSDGASGGNRNALIADDWAVDEGLRER